MNHEYRSVIIGTIGRVLVPLLQLYALYVVIHGHSSPGGGFQGGVILGSSFILLIIAVGPEEGRRRFSQKANDFFASFGVFIYGAIGLACIFMGANFLNYGVLPFPGASPVTSRYLGTLGIEIGVAISVTAIMVVIFLNLLDSDTSSEDDHGIHR